MGFESYLLRVTPLYWLVMAGTSKGTNPAQKCQSVSKVKVKNVDVWVGWWSEKARRVTP